MNKLLRVWGTCDNLQIEFTHDGGTTWSCKVPPDLKDGVYIANFWAKDDLGRIGHWNGFLYMSSGVCHFKFKDERYQMWFKPQNYKIEFKSLNDKKYQFDFNIDNYIFELKENKYQFIFKKGCKDIGNFRV